jgi:hypothetical protein
VKSFLFTTFTSVLEQPIFILPSKDIMQSSLSKPILVLTKTYDGGSTKVKTNEAIGHFNLVREIEWTKTRVSTELHPSIIWHDLQLGREQ